MDELFCECKERLGREDETHLISIYTITLLELDLIIEFFSFVLIQSIVTKSASDDILIILPSIQ